MVSRRNDIKRSIIITKSFLLAALHVKYVIKVFIKI